MSQVFENYFWSSGQYALEDLENWQPVPEYPGYWAHPDGYISKDDKILKHHKGDRQGHINVRLRKDGKQKEEYLHRLIAKTFIPNPHNYPIVRHLNDDKFENSVDNLAWGTQKDNYNDCVRNGNHIPFKDEDREKSYAKKRTPIIAIDLKTGEEKYYKGQKIAAKDLSLQQSNIHKVLTNKRVHTGGYSFRYAKKGEDDD